MKKIILLIVMLFSLTSVQAQDLFKKKNRKNKVDRDMPYVEDARPDERTKYFYETLLIKEDTCKLNEFLATGININVRATDAGANMRYYKTILMYAIDRCTISTVEYLLKHGADPNLRVRRYWEGMFGSIQEYRFSMYPLEAAAENGNIAKMDLLVKYGADVDRALDGLKEIATKKGNTAMMNWISEKTGASAIQSNSLAVMTSNSFELDASKVTVETINDLVKGGANVNAHAPNGKTALMNVIQVQRIKDRYELAKTLIKHGADVNQPDRVSDGYPGVNKYYPVSPLKAAVRNNDLRMVKILVEAGADVNQANGGETPLRAAKSDAVKEYLILNGAK